MNKYLYYENKLFNKINKKSIKYKCKIQLVDNLSANACVLKYNDQYLIYVSKKLNKIKTDRLSGVFRTFPEENRKSGSPPHDAPCWVT